jgi:Glycosyltransferase family 25 (LPS biosynthesis protein)
LNRPELPEDLDMEEVLHLLQEVDPTSALFKRSLELLDGRLEIASATIGSESSADAEAAHRRAGPSPFDAFDAIFCINLDSRPERWNDMQRRFAKLGIEPRVRRLSAANTPLNHHIGCALSHRRIIAEAYRQGWQTVLVFEDDARFSPDAAKVLALSLRELEGRAWQLLYLGGYRSTDGLHKVPGCSHLVVPERITCTHAIAYHHTVYKAILDAVPENAIDTALWVGAHLAIDEFYTADLRPTLFLTWPVIATQESIMGHEEREFDD